MTEHQITSKCDDSHFPGYGGMNPLEYAHTEATALLDKKRDDIKIRGFSLNGNTPYASMTEERYNYDKAVYPEGLKCSENPVERNRRKVDIPLSEYKASKTTWCIIFIRMFTALLILLICYIVFHQKYPKDLPWPEHLDPFITVEK